MSEIPEFNFSSQKKQYKYPYVLLGLFITCLLATVCLANKLTLIGNLLVPGGVFVFVFTFCICDIVGEVYGYAYPRLFIWIGVIAEFIFSLVVTGISHLPSPEYFNNSEAYKAVFDPTIRYIFSGVCGLLGGEFINVYLLAKLKIRLKGSLFIIRSFISTTLGQASLTIIVDVLNYTGKMPVLDLLKMMLDGYAWKMFFAMILVFPLWIIVEYLKRAEEMDYYDVNTNFNPFIFNLENPNISDTNKEENDKFVTNDI